MSAIDTRSVKSSLARWHHPATPTRIGAAEAALVAVDTKFATLDSRVERLDQIDGFGEHGQGLTSVDGMLDTFGERLDPVDSKLSVLDSRLGTVDSKVGTLSGTRLDGLDSRLAGVGARIDGLGDKFGALDGRLETTNSRFADVSGQLESLGQQLAAVGGRLDAVDEQLAGQLEPLADELRSRPGHMDIQDILAKIVDAAQSDVTTQLGSLEETVLTLGRGPAAAAGAGRVPDAAGRPGAQRRRRAPAGERGGPGSRPGDRVTGLGRRRPVAWELW